MAPLAQGCVGPNSTDRGKKMGTNAASWWTPVASRCRSSPAGPAGMTAIYCALLWLPSSVPGRIGSGVK